MLSLIYSVHSIEFIASGMLLQVDASIFMDEVFRYCDFYLQKYVKYTDKEYEGLIW
jgi:hypothetical protein